MRNALFKVISVFVLVAFYFETIIVNTGYAQMISLPSAASAVNLSESFHPVMVRGMRLNPDNGLNMSFIVDGGAKPLNEGQIKKESEKLIKYFLAALTIPEKDLWVNLSPYEKDRITPDALGNTEMGRDMLALDYMLKQMTATLLNPEGETGKRFWDKIYSQVYAKYGTSDLPIESLNKVWIMPDRVELFVQDDTILILNSRMKVMLEGDYLATDIYQSKKEAVGEKTPDAAVTKDVKGVMRDVIIPVLEDEVNNGEYFAQLRQIFSGLILAKCFKDNIKTSVLNRVYSNQEKVSGVDHKDANAIHNIYEQYLAAFQKGSEGVIKEDYDPQAQSTLARKYITGGENFTEVNMVRSSDANLAQLAFQGSITGPVFLADVDFSNVDKAMSEELTESNNAMLDQRLDTDLAYVGAKAFNPSSKVQIRVLEEGIHGSVIGAGVLAAALRGRNSRMRFVLAVSAAAFLAACGQVSNNKSAGRSTGSRKREYRILKNFDAVTLGDDKNSVPITRFRFVENTSTYGKKEFVWKSGKKFVVIGRDHGLRENSQYFVGILMQLQEMTAGSNDYDMRKEMLWYFLEHNTSDAQYKDKIWKAIDESVQSVDNPAIGFESAEEDADNKIIYEHLKKTYAFLTKNREALQLNDDDIRHILQYAYDDAVVYALFNNIDFVFMEAKGVENLSQSMDQAQAKLKELVGVLENPMLANGHPDKPFWGQFMRFLNTDEFSQASDQDIKLKLGLWFSDSRANGLAHEVVSLLKKTYKDNLSQNSLRTTAVVKKAESSGRNIVFPVGFKHLAVYERFISTNKAMMSREKTMSVNNGGIDFDAAAMITQTSGSGLNINIKDRLGDIDPAQIHGFVPSNIRLIPISDIGVLFGKSESVPEDNQGDVHLSSMILRETEATKV